MSTKTLRWLGVILPVAFWTALIMVRVYVTPHASTAFAASAELLLVALGGALFSWWVADRFDQHEAEILQRAQQLDALREASLAVATEVDLTRVLQSVVDLSRRLSGARYAALSVLDAEGKQVEEFITSGVTAEERARMGDPPQGHGLLGAIITERRAMRIDHISADPRAVGFPEHHPYMTTLLGVPLLGKGRLFGNLYLCDKVDPDGSGPIPFTDADQRTLDMFAAHASVAIDNARLHRQNQQIAIMQERERFGMNLHDGIIQSIYALGLLLDDAQHRADSEPEVARQRIAQTIAGLNEVIRDIRSYILDLRPQRFEGRSLEEGLRGLATAYGAHSPLEVHVSVEPAAAAAATPQQTAELLHLAQEALTNTQKHAAAERVHLHLGRVGGHLSLTIEDDGRGFDVFRTAAHPTGNGLRNMQERARALDGEIEIESQRGKGTRIAVSIPLAARNAASAATPSAATTPAAGGTPSVAGAARVRTKE